MWAPLCFLTGQRGAVVEAVVEVVTVAVPEANAGLHLWVSVTALLTVTSGSELPSFLFWIGLTRTPTEFR